MGIVVAGLPVLVSDQVDANTLFWGIPKQHVMFVQRKGTAVERFPMFSRTALGFAPCHRSRPGVPERGRGGSRIRRRLTNSGREARPITSGPPFPVVNSLPHLPIQPLTLLGIIAARLSRGVSPRLPR